MREDTIPSKLKAIVYLDSKSENPGERGHLKSDNAFFNLNYSARDIYLFGSGAEQVNLGKIHYRKTQDVASWDGGRPIREISYQRRAD